MNASATAVSFGSPRQSGDAALTPDLQQSRYMSGESDDDSAHATPTDMTLATQTSPRESWPLTKMRTAEDEVRKIHYIESPAQNPPITAIPAISAVPTERSTPATTPLAAASVAVEASTAAAPSQQPSILASITTTAATTMATQAEAVPASKTPTASASTTALPLSTTINSNPAQAPASHLPPSTASNNDNPSANATGAAGTAATETVVESADLLASRLASTAPSSAASTPASTPGAAPQTYARKRGRPRKHPLPDPNAPPKAKRKLSADNAATAAKKKANAAAAARSAASTSGSLLSVPDLGRLIPQGSTSENAQNFIQNNLRLFADLFVALQKQASTDHSVRDEANAQLKDISEVSVDQPMSATQASTDGSAPALSAAVSGGVDASTNTNPSSSQADPASDVTASSSKVSGPSDGIRDEIKKKMADVAKGREAIQAEMLQMRVDASFFENAQKTVDERIVILRERIAKHTALLQREREATRKVREATRMAKKDRKVREKGLRASEREERRLAQTFLQLEREIAAEEEERRRLEDAESSDEEDGAGVDDEPATSALGQSHGAALDHLDGFNPAVMDATPSDATSMSATATPSVTNDTPAAADRAIGFSDEELAKVLGISTSELAGFSQTLELTSLQAPSASLSSADTDTAAQMAQATFASLLAPTQSDEPPVSGSSDAAADSFDVAAFLEMASSFGAVTSNAPPAEQQDESA